MTPQLEHARFKADLRAQRRLLEDHRQLLARQDAVRLADLLLRSSAARPAPKLSRSLPLVKSATETKLRPFMLSAMVFGTPFCLVDSLTLASL